MATYRTFTQFIAEIEGECTYSPDHLDRYEAFYLSRHPLPTRKWVKLIFRGFFGPKVGTLPKPEYEQLNNRQQYQYDVAQDTFEIGLAEKMLEPKDLIGNTFDFGCGQGGSSLFLHAQGGNVEAIDLRAKNIEYLQQTGLLPENKAIVGNGLERLLQKTCHYDLITAFGFGSHATPRSFVQEFYQASHHAIKPGGKIVVVSDLLTMDNVRDVFQVETLPYFQRFMIYTAKDLSRTLGDRTV